MKEFWQKLWIKLGRMGRKQFFLIHLFMMLGIIASPFLCICATFLICGDGNDSFGCKTMEGLLERLLEGDGLSLIILFLYLVSNFFLAKRFQDCGTCGIRAFILGLILPIAFPIVLIVMCFEKGDAGPNKYGNPV